MLVARLSRSSDVARFIVAPSGYGKSILALEYAETMKYWAHTFWVNAQSPCFIRDLDAGGLSSSILELDGEASLVVLDDLPPLDPERQALLSREIDTLLSASCEVIATCVPACDTLGPLQPDRLRVSAADLLLNDEEIDDLRSSDERSRMPASQIGPAYRVPLLAWSHLPDSGKRFVQGMFSEELPTDVLLVQGSALVLQEGSLADLLTFGQVDALALEEVRDDYPHMGLDMESECFEAPLIQMDDLASTLRSCLPKLVNRSTSESTEQLVRAWAAALLRNGQAARACETIQNLCPRTHRASWVADNATELVRQVCLFPLLKLTVAQRAGSGSLGRRLNAIEALCRRLLGDETGAIQCAKRCAFDEAAPEDARTVGLLIVARLDAGAPSQQARDILEEMQLTGDGSGSARRSKWQLLVEAWRTQAGGVSNMARLWQSYYEQQVEDDVLCLCASWLFSLFDESVSDIQQDDLTTCRMIERYLRERLIACTRQDRIDYYLASAGLSMESAHAYGLPFEGGVLETPTLIMLRRVEMDVISQRRTFEEDARLEQVRRDDWVKTHPASLAGGMSRGTTTMPERSVPLLTLKMFGCFEASLGGIPIEYGRFSRQNTRALLVLLAVNQGRELSRDALAEAMWPNSSLDVARKNFYSVWSNLRSALSLPDGTCPYLIRHRYGCSLDGRLVQSDVERFNEICRELLFSAPNIEHWSLLFAEIDRDFSGDLMPAETKNGLIVQARNDYRTRLVDALITATMSILDAGIPQWGVWFARSAVKHDDTREDAYVALMRAQIAGNQRTAAMMTYLKCRRVLAEKLGIDPSPETTALYESLLDSE